jgi:hypothetical protein
MVGGKRGQVNVRKLLQLRVLRLGFFQNWDVGVGVFPEREESADDVRYCGSPTFRTSSANRGLERRESNSRDGSVARTGGELSSDCAGSWCVRQYRSHASAGGFTARDLTPRSVEIIDATALNEC